MGLLGDIKFEIQKRIWMRKNKYLIKKGAWQPTVMSLSDTMKYIKDNGVSISRFGDGEFKWMLDLPQNSFQSRNEKLTIRLKEIMAHPPQNVLICIPDVFDSLVCYKRSVRYFWSMIMCKERNMLKDRFPNNYEFGNLNVTRFYIDYVNSKHVSGLISSWKKLWEDRDIVIIEGELSRLGVGNDLFNGTRTIRRILAPAKDAFSVYSEIIDCIENMHFERNTLFLLALGPTATVLACDLSKMGYQAIDIGHIDIEYEWYRVGANKKIPIASKYVNEASKEGGNIVSDIEDVNEKSKYLDQIIARV